MASSRVWINKLLNKDELELFNNFKKSNEKDLLFKILSDKILSLNAVDIDDSNWAIKRAFYDGQKVALQNLLTLLD